MRANLEDGGRWLRSPPPPPPPPSSSEPSSSVSELKLLLSVNADFFPPIISPEWNGRNKFRINIKKLMENYDEVPTTTIYYKNSMFCTGIISPDDTGQARKMWDFFNVVLGRLEHNLFHLLQRIQSLLSWQCERSGFHTLDGFILLLLFSSFPLMSASWAFSSVSVVTTSAFIS